MKDMKNYFSLARLMVDLMDNRFQLFGKRFGIDPILNIIPGFGNIFGAGISFYLFWIAYELDVPKNIYRQMARNIGIDFLLGSIPLAGVVFDLLYKANVKNLVLLEPYIEKGIINGEVLEDTLQ